MSSNSKSFNITKEEESCLKTALAFVVMRRRRSQISSSSSSNKKQQQSILESLVPKSYPSHLLLPSKEDHLRSMFNVCISTAQGFYNQSTTTMLYSSKNTSAMLDGLLSHISSQLLLMQDKNAMNAVLRQILLKNDDPIDILCLCTVFYRLAAREPKLMAVVARTICREIHDLYHNNSAMSIASSTTITTDALLLQKKHADENKFLSSSSPRSTVSIRTVNLLHLLEDISRLATTCNQKPFAQIILSVIQQELMDISLAVPFMDMAYFYHVESKRKKNSASSLDPGEKMILRLFLMDIMQRLSLVL